MESRVWLFDKTEFLNVNISILCLLVLKELQGSGLQVVPKIKITNLVFNFYKMRVNQHNVWLWWFLHCSKSGSVVRLLNITALSPNILIEVPE